MPRASLDKIKIFIMKEFWGLYSLEDLLKKHKLGNIKPLCQPSAAQPGLQESINLLWIQVTRIRMGLLLGIFGNDIG